MTMEFDEATKHVLIRDMTVGEIEQAVQHLKTNPGYFFEIGSTGEDGGTLVYCSDAIAAILLRLGGQLQD